MKKESKEPVFHSRTLFAVFILVFALAGGGQTAGLVLPRIFNILASPPGLNDW